MSANSPQRPAPQLAFDLFRLEGQVSGAGPVTPEKRAIKLKPLKYHHRDTRIDWFKLLEDMAREGYSLYELEVLTGIPKSTLMGYRNQGTEPRHDNGEKLIAFWSQVTHSKPERVPRTARAMSAGDFRK